MTAMLFSILRDGKEVVSNQTSGNWRRPVALRNNKQQRRASRNREGWIVNA